MKEISKRTIAVVVAVCIALAGSLETGFAARDLSKANVRAEALATLGLLKGVDKGNYDLRREPTRIEGVVMLIRLLGKEKEALQFEENAHPFKDVPDWADRYVGYAYQNGITKGFSTRTFGANFSIHADQYLTFLLRALEYSDEAGDFNYKSPEKLAASLGMLTDEIDRKAFLRADLVMLSYNTLFVFYKDKTETLGERLIAAKVFTQEQWESAMGLTALLSLPLLDYEWEPAVSYTLTSKDQFLPQMRQAVITLPETIFFYVPRGQEKAYMAQYDKIYRDLAGYIMRTDTQYSVNAGYISIKPTYSVGYSAQSYLQNPTAPVSGETKAIARKGLSIYEQFIAGQVSDYDKVKKIHDYLAETLSYDQNNLEGSGDLDGALTNGKATCGGYSAAFRFFSWLSGIEAEFVIGPARNEQGRTEDHAWNMAKVSGKWYHIDVTWDDPITSWGENMIRYTFFLVGDTQLGKTHKWNKNHYPVAGSSWVD